MSGPRLVTLPAMASSTVLRLLGPVELVAAGRVVPLGGPVITALFVRLVVAGRTGPSARAVPDDVLYDAVWDGEQWPDAPGGALRSSMTRLRKAVVPIGLDIRRRSDGYAVEGDRVGTDIDELSELEHLAHRGDGAEALDAATDALALWRGPSTTGIRQMPFGRELAAELDRRRSLLEDRWAELNVALGHPKRAVAFLEGAVRAEPTNELRWALLAVARARSGHPRDGLQAITTARSELVAVGLLPGRRLLDAEQLILAGSEEPAASVAATSDANRTLPATSARATAPRPPAVRNPSRELAALGAHRFVGRARELERLDEIRTRAEERSASEVVVVGGEAGAGKSALVAEACRGLAEPWALRFGWVPAQGSGPLDALRSTLSEALDADPLLRMEPAGRLLQELLDGGADPSDALGIAAIDPVVRRAQILDAARDALGRLSPGPVVIVVDDAHWADDLTVELLRSIARRPLPAAIVFLVTERTGGSLHQARGATTLPLEPLSDHEVAALLGRTVDDPWTGYVVAETEGVPLLVAELLRSGLDPSGAAPAVADPELRSRLGARLLGERISGLGERARETLLWGAVLGASFRFSDLRAVSGLRDLEALDDIDAAVELRVLTFDVVEPDVLRFVHDLFVAAIERTTTPLRLARLHAEALETLGPARLDPQVALHHARRSSSFVTPALIAEVAVRAGDVLLAQFRFDELRGAMEWALGALDPTDDSLAAGRSHLLTLLARADAAGGDADRTRASFADALAAAQRAGDPIAVARVLRARKVLGTEFGDADLAPAFRAAVAALAPDDVDTRFELLRGQFAEEEHLGRFDAAEAVIAELRSLVPVVRTPFPAAAVARLEHRRAELSGDAAGRRHAIGRVEREAGSSGDLDSRAWLHQAQVIESLHGGDHAGAAHHGAELSALGRTTGMPIDDWLGLLFRFPAPFVDGDIGEARARADEAFGRGRAAGVSGSFGAYASQQFALAWLGGGLDAFIDQLTEIRLTRQDLVWRSALALALVTTGDHAAAQDVLDHARSAVGSPVTDWLSFVGVALAAEAASWLGDVPTMLAAQPCLRRRVGDHVLLGAGAVDYGPARRYLALTLMGAGEVDEGAAMLVEVRSDPGAGAVWRVKAERDLQRLGRAPTTPIESGRQAIEWWPERTNP